MFQYEITITGSDLIGVTFIKRLLEFSGKGAVLKEDRSLNLRFPQRCTMSLETEEKLESSPGIIITDVAAKKSKKAKDEPASLVVDSVVEDEAEETSPSKGLTEEQLAELSWNDFREAVGKAGVKGTKRETMVGEYLVATAQKE